MIFSALRLSQLSGGGFLTPGKACRVAQGPANTGLLPRFARVPGSVNGIVFFVYTQGIQKEFSESAIFPSVFRALGGLKGVKRLSRVGMLMAGIDKGVSLGCHKELTFPSSDASSSLASQLPQGTVHAVPVGAGLPAMRPCKTPQNPMKPGVRPCHSYPDKQARPLIEISVDTLSNPHL